MFYGAKIVGSNLEAQSSSKCFFLNCLSTHMCLKDKGVICLENGVLCNSSNEDNLLLYFQSQSSLNVWNIRSTSTSISVTNLIQQEMNINEIIFKVLQVLSLEDTTFVIVYFGASGNKETIRFEMR